MFRGFFAIAVGITALCFAQVPQSDKKIESASDPFGGPPAVVRGQDATETAEAEAPFGSDPVVDETSGEDDPFFDEQTKAGQANADPFGSDPAAAETLDPFRSKPKTGSVAQETERLGSLERKHAALELDANKYAADMRLKYASNQMYPNSVRQKLRDKIEAAFDAREKVQRQRIHLARVRLDAAEERLSKGLVRSKFAVEQRVERLLGKRSDSVATTESSEQPQSTMPGPATRIPPGMRVVTVSVEQTTSHTGMLTPGNRIDVMLTYMARTDDGVDRNTRTVLQFIEVFAVDRPISEERTTRNVSVLVTPRQARILLLAQARGNIHLALRSSQDTGVSGEDELTVLSWLGSEEAAQPVASADQNAQVMLIIHDALNKVGKELQAKEREYEKFTRSSPLGPAVQILSDRLASISESETTIQLELNRAKACLLYTSPSPRDATLSRMPSSA